MEEYNKTDIPADESRATVLDIQTEKARKNFFIVWTIVGAIPLTGIVVYLFNILSVPVGIVLWSVVIIFGLRGLVDKLEKLGMPRVWGTTVAYLVMFLVLGVAALLMFSPALGVGEQFTNLAESIPAYLSNIIAWSNGIYAKYAHFLADATVQKYLNDMFESVGIWVSDLAKSSATGVVAVGAGIANSFMAIGFALVVAFWILTELPALGRESMRLAGPKHAETLIMLHMTFSRVMGGYIKGTLLQCGVIGLSCGIVFAVLGVPNYAALGGITGLLNIIPIVGPWLGGALAALVGVFVSPWIAFLALAMTIIIQQIVYTFISPKIMASSVDVHPALTLIALVAGSAIGGAMSGFMGSLVGMLVSIPAVAVAKSVFVYYFEKRTGRQLVNEDGVFFQGVSTSAGKLDPIADVISPHLDASMSLGKSKQRKTELEKRVTRHKKR